MPKFHSLSLYLLVTLVAFAMILAAPLAQSQTLASTASFSGTISDPSGARIANAAVTFGSLDNGVTRTFKTDVEGNFSFALLPAGIYTLRIEAPGFKTLKQTGITLEVGQSASQNISLNVGASEQIEVTADAPLLQIDNANVGAEVSTKQITELPLNLRNVFNFVELNSSVNNASQRQTISSGGQQGSADQDVSFFNFGGGYFGTTAFLLDGLWDASSGWGGVIYVPSPDNVQEFKVQQNSFTAQYGWSTGNVINEAIPAYQKALALNPHLPGIQLDLGLAEFKQGHFQTAIAPLSAALTADPRSDQARTLLGMSYYGAHRFSEAVNVLRPASDADPGNLELRQILAQSCLSAKQYNCAADEFKKIVQQNPDSAAAHMLTGEALDGLYKTNDAIAEFETAEKLAPQEPNVHFGLGYLYWEKKRYADAEHEFKAELALDPGHAQALAYLGDISLKNNDLDSAKRLLQQSTSLQKNVRIAYLDLGNVLMQQEHYQEALAAFKHAEKLSPTEPDAPYRLGRIYTKMGNSQLAAQEFAKVKKLHKQKDEAVSLVMPQTPAIVKAPQKHPK